MAKNISSASSGVVNSFTPSLAITSVVDFDGVPVASGSTVKGSFLTLSGTAVPGAPVLIFVDGQRQVVTFADSDGNWSRSISAGRGEVEIKVTSLDGSSAVFYLNVVPEPVIVTPVIDNAFADETGFLDLVPQGAVTQDATPLLQGRSTANATVDILVNGQVVGSTVADQEGRWSYTPQLEEGFNTLSILVDGQMSEPYVITVQQDTPVTEPVAAPNINAAWSNNDPMGGYAEIRDGSGTDDRTPGLRGQAEPHQLVSILVNGNVVASVMTDSFGKWSYSPTLEEGRNEIVVSSQGQFSTPFVIDYGQEPTVAIKPVIGAVWNADPVGGAFEIVNGGEANDRVVSLQGRAEPNARVDILLNGDVVASTRADQFGKWNHNLELQSGRSEISVSSQGLASDSFVIEYPSLVAPVEPIATIVANYSGESDIASRYSQLHGKAPANAAVDIHVNGRVVGVTYADASGDWRFGTALPDGESVLTVSVEGRFGEELVVTVVGSPPPTIDAAWDNEGQNSVVAHGGFTDDRTPELRGIAQPDSIIQIYQNGQLVGNAQADINGYWGFTPQLGEGRSELYVVEGAVASALFELHVQDAPIITALYGDDNVLIGEGDNTSASSFVIAGKAQPDALVDVYVNNNRPIQVRADEHGDWRQEIAPGDGNNFIVVYSGGQYSEGYSFNYLMPVFEGLANLDEAMVGYPSFGLGGGAQLSLGALSLPDLLSANENELFARPPAVADGAQGLSLGTAGMDMGQSSSSSGVELHVQSAPAVDGLWREEYQALGTY